MNQPHCGQRGQRNHGDENQQRQPGAFMAHGLKAGHGRDQEELTAVPMRFDKARVGFDE